MAKELGWDVDMDGFSHGLEEQKNRSRSAATVETGDWNIIGENTGETEFVGYDQQQAEVKIIRYRKTKTKGKEFYQLVLDKTPFYAESGGQVGDRGILDFGDETISIEDTRKENDLIVHLASNLPKILDKPCIATVDQRKRISTANNHSATHLMHAALR